jgi:site-specific DNA-methyltransferase (adenine-specific)
MQWEVISGGVLGVLRDGVPDNTFDAVLCDPPYGIKFMSHKWDVSVPSAETWAEILRVLKPGGHALAFGGTRTYHHLVMAMENGGFEIRDQLAWIYGQGMPKSLNVSKAIDKKAGAVRPVTGTRTLRGTAALSTKEKGGTYSVGGGGKGRKVEVAVTGNATEDAKLWDGYGTALKPSLEPICLARKPLDGNVAENCLTHGCGALNIGGTKMPRDPSDASRWSKTGSKAGKNLAMSGDNYARDPKPDTDARWPANVIFDEEAGAALDEQAGERPSGARASGVRKGMGFHGANGDGGPAIVGSTGGASRFFYQAKVSPTERGDSKHPTMKPVALTTYLAKLLLPPSGGRLLVPFSGVGSEMLGALLAGWQEVLGIELDPNFAQFSRERLAKCIT